MKQSRSDFLFSWVAVLVAFILLSLCQQTAAENSGQWVQSTDANGNTVWLAENRKPALYTQNFGDCIGDSLINVTRFDAAYYKDNMTVIFHLAGNTAVKNESLMMYIGVFAYGEQRFELVFNPCNANIYSLCPMNGSVPIEASGIIPVAQSDVAGIPSIALNIPDFEGQAILRIFANSTQSQIACYSALVTNGSTFSHPAAVGTVLGVFTVIALFASMIAAIYGDSHKTTRQHYAHSLSILVVFAVFHHIFFTGALSMNWPSVLVAFWSNFAWSAGMIYSTNMQNSINQLIGSNKGNISIVGAASVGENANLGGGYQLSDIYKRSIDAPGLVDVKSILTTRIYEEAIAKRQLANSSDGFSWYGSPVRPGLPLPGNFSGFAGTLSAENIPASNAFMTGFLWFLILVAIVAASVATLKWTIEGLSRMENIKTERLAYFRSHWKNFMIFAVLRTCYIAFFMTIVLTMFQFTFKGSAGVTAIAVLVFTVFVVGMGAITGYACFCRLRIGKYNPTPDRLNIERTKKFGFIPWYGFLRESNRAEKGADKSFVGSVPWFQVRQDNAETAEDEAFQKKYGWLSARFRGTRWWFFAPWLLYEFVRACFFGGAAGHAMTQVFGILAVEFIALVAIVWMKPFEGARLNALVVYFLGFSKVATVALSSAFDLRFNLDRITTTVIGIVIIVIQAILTILLLIAIAAGALTSYISVTRNREEFHPKSWSPLREKYIRRVEHIPAPRPPTPPPVPEIPKEPYFTVTSVKRLPKIEDDDDDLIASMTESKTSVVPEKDKGRCSGAGSLRSQLSHSSLPYGARPHRMRASWSSADFANWSHENDQLEISPNMQISQGSLREGMRTRASSRAGATPSRQGTMRAGPPQGPPIREHSDPSSDVIHEHNGNGKQKGIEG